MGLLDADTLRSAGMTASFRGEGPQFPGPFRPGSGPIPATFRGGISTGEANTGAAFDQNDDDHAPTAYVNGISSTSYRTSIAAVDA
jgi:hypothetical protein